MENMKKSTKISVLISILLFFALIIFFVYGAIYENHHTSAQIWMYDVMNVLIGSVTISLIITWVLLIIDN